MSKNVQEFVRNEIVSATMTMPLAVSEEHFGSPVSIGYYDNGSSESWVEFEGVRLNIPDGSMKLFIKQLERVHRLARENSKGDKL